MICYAAIASQFLTFAIADHFPHSITKSTIFACPISDKNRQPKQTSRFGITVKLSRYRRTLSCQNLDLGGRLQRIVRLLPLSYLHK